MEKWKFQSAYDGEQHMTPGMWAITLFATHITIFMIGYWVGHAAPFLSD